MIKSEITVRINTEFVNPSERELRNFWKKVDKNGPIPKHRPELGMCYMWKGSTHFTGYGYFNFLGKVRRAHRASWMIHYGSIPQGLLVCHHCDNPSCVRPEHLFVGTKFDNSSDMISKNRQKHPRGDSCVFSKLTTDKVLYIKRKCTEGVPRKELALQFGVCVGTIDSIMLRRVWRHVT